MLQVITNIYRHYTTNINNIMDPILYTKKLGKTPQNKKAIYHQLLTSVTSNNKYCSHIWITYWSSIASDQYCVILDFVVIDAATFLPPSALICFNDLLGTWHLAGFWRTNWCIKPCVLFRNVLVKYFPTFNYILGWLLWFVSSFSNEI